MYHHTNKDRMGSHEWKKYQGGSSIGQTGSEGGQIVKDEEFGSSARITLEEGGTSAPFAITCGVSGSFFHTRHFGSTQECNLAFDEMKPELSKISRAIDLSQNQAASPAVDSMIKEFIKKFS